MRDQSPFQRDDLNELNDLLSRAAAVVSMREIADGVRDYGVVGMRHDVDDNAGSFETALNIAQWESDRNFRASFFVLHTASYWNSSGFRDGLEKIAGFGHEIGLHINALAQSLRTGRDSVEIVQEAVAELRDWGHPVQGVVAHGDELCRKARFVNDEMFEESARPSYGSPDRTIEHGGVAVAIKPVSRADFGFEYDPNWLPRAMYVSDSGGQWSLPFNYVAEAFPTLKGQLHVLWHSDWWREAFE